MKTFNVYGSTTVLFTMEVEAEDAEQAKDLAYNDFEALSGYAGNGGSDKLVGTTLWNVSLEPSEDFTIDEVEEQ